MIQPFPLRVYYEDTDAAGVVYNANYLKFAERARTELLREIGLVQAELWEEQGIGFVLRRCEVDFLSPARLDDLLTIHTRLEDIGGVSLAMQQTIFRDKKRLCALAVGIGVVGHDFRPCRLPAPVRAALQQLLTTT